MTSARCAIVLLAAWAVFSGSRAAAQLQGTAPAARNPESTASTAPEWGIDLSGFTVDPPHDDAYAATVLRVDRAELHLEGRWNYEDLHTGSLFAGFNLEWQGLWHEKLDVTAVPMAGVVGGDTHGLAPGLLVGATWGMFDLWSESEYVFDLDDGDDSWFYTWNELGISPVEWLRFGFVAQRTRVYDQELSVDRGLLLGGSLGPATATVYWFNPDDGSESYFTFAVAFSF